MRLYLHIGIGKTGTSSIQRMLAASAGALAERGFYYPQTGRNGADAHHWLAPFACDELDEDVEALFETLRGELDAQNAPNAVLSSEGFCYCRPRVVRRIGALLAPYDVRVIFYARRPVELIASAYLEKVKSGDLVGATLEEFHQSSVWERSFFMGDRLNPWAIEFGRNALTVRLYDRRYLKGDSVSDFLDALGIADMPNELGEVRENISVSPALLPCLEAFDRVAPASPRRPQLVAALVNASEDVSGTDLMSDELRKQIARDHANENSIFATTFFDHERAGAFMTP
jgi:hypothetical protein